MFDRQQQERLWEALCMCSLIVTRIRLASKCDPSVAEDIAGSPNAGIFPQPYTIPLSGVMPQQMPLKDKQNRAAAESVSSAPAESAPAHDGFSFISNQKLLELYATMLKCRLLDERIRVERARLAKSEDGIRHIPLPAKGPRSSPGGGAD
jgi:hypothetical protein